MDLAACGRRVFSFRKSLRRRHGVLADHQNRPLARIYFRACFRSLIPGMKPTVIDWADGRVLLSDTNYRSSMLEKTPTRLGGCCKCCFSEATSNIKLLAAALLKNLQKLKNEIKVIHDFNASMMALACSSDNEIVIEVLLPC
jgi:hypothetical protein